MPYTKKRTRSRSGGPAHPADDDDDGHGAADVRHWCWYLPPALAAGVYCNSLAGDLVHDDVSAIAANRDITDPSAGAWDFLYNDFWGTAMSDPTSHKSYRPLTILTFKWNYALTGLDTWSYHAANVLLHSAVTWLLARLCRRSLRLPVSTSLLAACLFAVHPIHTEAVSGIVGRADVLATLFFLLSFISHDRASKERGSSPNHQRIMLLRASSLVAALLALAAKENGIAALPVAATWDVIRLHRSARPRAKTPSEKLSLPANLGTILFSIAVTIGLLAVRIGLLQKGQLPLFSEQDNPAAFASDKMARLLTLLYLPAFNMGLLLAPVLLSYDWQNGSIPLVEDWRDWRNFASLAFYTALVGALVVSWLHRKTVMMWCIAVMVWPMLPASNLFYPCGFVVAERLLYLPSAGYCVMVAFGLDKAYRCSRSRWRRPGPARGCQPSVNRESTCSSWSARCLVIAGCGLLLATAHAAKTWTRNADWTDRRTLFESGLRTLPNNAKMHYNYANVQKDDGRWEAAIDHYRRAIALWPGYASALNNLGTVLLARADELDESDATRKASMKEAEERFGEAIRSHPHHVHAHYNLAVIHMQRNETDRAVNLLKKCLVLNARHREAARLLHWIESGASEHMDAMRSLTRAPIRPATPATRSRPAAQHASSTSRWNGANNRWPSRANYRWNDTAGN